MNRRSTNLARQLAGARQPLTTAARRAAAGLALASLVCCSGPSDSPGTAAHSDRPESISLTHEPVPRPAIDWAPRTYVARRAAGTLEVDGKLSEGDWAVAPWTEDFIDIEGPTRPQPHLRTRAKVLWDDRALWIGAELEEPHVWGTLTERDAVIYQDDDFEVFIDPDGDTHGYYELEINALGTEWDLLLIRPYRDGGPAIHAWDIPGLRSAVYVSGTVNEPADRDSGWSVEIAIPWTGLAEATDVPVPPRAGDRWRVNFSRVDWPVDVRDGRTVKRVDAATGEAGPERNWVWSPQGLVAMHYPEMWGFLEFADQAGPTDAAGPADAPGVGVNGSSPVIRPAPAERAGWLLRRVYYAQHEYRSRTGRWADDASELGMGSELGLAITPHGFEAWVTLEDGRTVRIDEEGRVRVPR